MGNKIKTGACDNEMTTDKNTEDFVELLNSDDETITNTESNDKIMQLIKDSDNDSDDKSDNC